jgi:hypothetical protein
MKIRSWFSAAALAAFSMVATSTTPADAFCGFYVAPSDGPLYNDATQVALMRDGTRTVISMSNNYRGPLADFAMVVPVPVVLQKENVKTLPRGAFEKLESLSAPRLVEYWEQDPCFQPKYDDVDKKGAMPSTAAAEAPGAGGRGYGVKIEAQFTVGEYDIVILSAKDSDGLERWLGDNKYKIPKGSAEALAPYVKEQMKFFVAKVDATKVTRDESGAVVLSPLRFNYEETTFKLPVRLGLLNAPAPGSGAAKQDLIVYVLAENKRYEVANYPNAFIPTNIDVTNETRKSFGSFYATLFDATIAKAGGRAVVTEYSWQSSSCDPCPTPPLEDADIATLGGDVLFGMGAPPPPPTPPGAGDAGVAPLPGALPTVTGGGRMGGGMGGYYGGSAHPVVLTRLHTRYDASTLTEDLVFKAADAVVGGREFVVDDKGNLEKGAKASTYGNNFQARYAIRHPWDGPVLCANPRRGIWGGPPAGKEGTTAPAPAKGLAAAPRGGVSLASYVSRGLDDVGEYDKALGLKPPAPKGDSATAAAKAKAKAEDVPPIPPKGKCGCSTPGSDAGLDLGAMGALALATIGLARRGARRMTRAGKR